MRGASGGQAGSFQRRRRRIPGRKVRTSVDVPGAPGCDQGAAVDGLRRPRYLPAVEAGRGAHVHDRKGPDRPAGASPGPAPEVGTVPELDEEPLLTVSRDQLMGT